MNEAEILKDVGFNEYGIMVLEGLLFIDEVTSEPRTVLMETILRTINEEKQRMMSLSEVMANDKERLLEFKGSLYTLGIIEMSIVQEELGQYAQKRIRQLEDSETNFDKICTLLIDAEQREEELNHQLQHLQDLHSESQDKLQKVRKEYEKHKKE